MGVPFKSKELIKNKYMMQKLLLCLARNRFSGFQCCVLSGSVVSVTLVSKDRNVIGVIAAVCD